MTDSSGIGSLFPPEGILRWAVGRVEEVIADECVRDADDIKALQMVVGVASCRIDLADNLQRVQRHLQHRAANDYPPYRASEMEL